MTDPLTPDRLEEIVSITEEAGGLALARGDNGILLDATRDLLAEVGRLQADVAALGRAAQANLADAEAARTLAGQYFLEAERLRRLNKGLAGRIAAAYKAPEDGRHEDVPFILRPDEEAR